VKKFLTILSLVLALCMMCGLALAEDTGNSGEDDGFVQTDVTRTIVIKNDKGEVIKEIVVTRFEKENDDGTVTVEWRDEFGNDWGDEDVIVEDGHDFTMDDTDYPANNDNVTVLFMPNGERNGQFRVHCKNHPNDKEDVKEYTIYFADHQWPSKTEVMAAIANGTFNKDSFEGFKSYTAPNCETGKAGKAVVTCIGGNEVHWNADMGRYEAHDSKCTNTKSYTLKAEHLWSDENPDKAEGQPYHDLVKPTCYKEGQVVGYCLLCGIDKNEVKGDSAIVTVKPLFHHTITDEPAWEERVKSEANCRDEGITTLWCTICEDWISDEECAQLYADGEVDTEYPIVVPKNGVHRYSVWIFDAYAPDENGDDKVETCTKDGEGYFHRICQLCHTVFGTEKRVIPAHGHEWGDDEEFGWQPKAGTFATCSIPAQEERICSWCKGEEDGGKEERDGELDDMKHFKVENGQVVLNENGVPVSALVLDELADPDCEETGYNKYHCEICGQIVYEVVVKNHDWEVKHQDGWCGGQPQEGDEGEADSEEEVVLYGNHTYDYNVCKNCGKIVIVQDYGVVEHNFNPWELRNEYQLYDDGEWTPEYWVRYCKNVHNGEKCAYHEDFVRDFAVNAEGKTPEDVLAEEAQGGEDPIDQSGSIVLPAAEEAPEVTKIGNRYKINGKADIADSADLPDYAYVRLTLFYADGSAEVTFTSLNLTTGTFTYATSRPFLHVSAIVLNNNEEINDAPEDQMLSEGTGWDFSL